jgi:hypothetical protein
MTKVFGFARMAAMLVTIGVIAVVALTFGGQVAAAGDHAGIGDIDGIYVQERPGGMQGFRWDVHLFFKNGEAYRRIDVPIEDLDVNESKRTDPDRWVIWRRKGDSFFFSAPDGVEKRIKIRWKMIPGGEDEDLSGRKYSANSSSVDTVTGTAVAWGHDIYFLDGHRYTSGKFSGFTSGRVVAYQNQHPEASGTYRISGYTIEFAPQEGTPHRELFFFGDAHGAKDENVVGIAGKFYLRKK